MGRIELTNKESNALAFFASLVKCLLCADCETRFTRYCNNSTIGCGKRLVNTARKVEKTGGVNKINFFVGNR